MEIKKCSFPEHSNVDAISYCHECKIYMCVKCEKVHSGLCINHHQYKIDKNFKDIFTGFCKEENHVDKLEYFCKTHNQLCCSACIVKIKKSWNGQHTDCDVCIIEDIKNDKKCKLQENLKSLEKLSNTLQDSINELKLIFEKINENKEQLKLNIEKIFTKIRSAINDREDELLMELDNKFDIKEENVKESQKLPNKIKSALEKGKIINQELNNENSLSSFINDCIIIENRIKDISTMNEKIKKYNSLIFDMKFNYEDSDLNNIINLIKNFGNINYNVNEFKNSKIILSNTNDYDISGENNNIITKTGSDGYRGTLIKNELEKDKENIWKIKMKNSTDHNHFYIGVAPDYLNNKSSQNKCGWYFYCWNSTLTSGPPHQYNSKQTNLNIVKEEVTIIMNMKKGTLKFIVDNEDKGESYTGIPIDKPLYPAIFMYYTKDSVELIKCK